MTTLDDTRLWVITHPNDKAARLALVDRLQEEEDIPRARALRRVALMRLSRLWAEDRDRMQLGYLMGPDQSPGLLLAIAREAGLTHGHQTWLNMVRGPKTPRTSHVTVFSPWGEQQNVLCTFGATWLARWIERHTYDDWHGDATIFGVLFDHHEPVITLRISYN